LHRHLGSLDHPDLTDAVPACRVPRAVGRARRGRCRSGGRRGWFAAFRRGAASGQEQGRATTYTAGRFTGTPGLQGIGSACCVYRPVAGTLPGTCSSGRTAIVSRRTPRRSASPARSPCRPCRKPSTPRPGSGSCCR
jgi:hypothetical protein